MILGEDVAGDETAVVVSGALAIATISEGKYCSQKDEK